MGKIFKYSKIFEHLFAWADGRVHARARARVCVCVCVCARVYQLSAEMYTYTRQRQFGVCGNDER